MALAWLCGLGGKKAGPRRGHRIGLPRAPGFTPRLEVLESRALLSAGALDPGFGTGGKVITDFGASETADLVAIQPDGKIVVAGNIFDPSTGSQDFLVARYNADGSLDTSFGAGGKVTTDFGGLDLASGVALLHNGDLVVVGGTITFSPTINADVALVRYNADGSLDTSFGTGGKVITDFGGFDVTSAGVAVLPNGDLAVGGYTADPSFSVFDFLLVRYNKDGSLDQGFGTGGKVTTDFGGLDVSTGIAAGPNGMIVLAGYTDKASSGSDFDFALARYNADGSLDTSFGTSGKVTTDFGGLDFASEVALLPNGDIVVAGWTQTSSPTFRADFALARYNADGSLDQGFGTGGLVTTDFGRNDFAYGLAVRPDGTIVVAGGSADSFGIGDFALARYNADGSLDQGFGTGGLVTTDFGGADTAIAVAFEPDGDIVAVGGTLDLSTFLGDLALARYIG
jgi:uncharacterized delta-60 repeat protein